MTIRFVETNVLGEGWMARVCDSGVPVGHIRQNPRSGTYRYFDGIDNRMTVSLENDSLESLKRALLQSQRAPDSAACR
jgi:hypothetical protein